MAIHVFLKAGFQCSPQLFALFWRQLFFCFVFHIGFFFIGGAGDEAVLDPRDPL